MRVSKVTLFALLALSSIALAERYDVPIAGSPSPGDAGARGMAYSPDGKWAAVASVDGSVTTYAVDAVGALHLIGVWGGTPCSGEVHLAFAQDSLDLFTTCSDDDFVRLHTIESDGSSNSVGGAFVGQGPVGIATTPDGYVFTANRDDQSISILRYGVGALQNVADVAFPEAPTAIAASRDGSLIAISSTGVLETFRHDGDNLTFASTTFNPAAGAAAFSTDLKLLVIADPARGGFFYYRLGPNGALPDGADFLITGRPQPADLAFDRDGDVLAVVISGEGIVKQFAYDGANFAQKPDLGVQGAVAVAFGYNPSLPTMAIATTGGPVSVFGSGPPADTTTPSVSCGAASGAWSNADVTIACTASDSGSGLADPSQSSFTLHTSVPAGAASANAATNSVQVCDRANNCTTAGPVGGNKVDKRPPTVAIAAPANGAHYGVLAQLLSPVTVSYSCSDADSGIAACTGSVANGSTLSLGLFDLGSHSISVTATDVAGNSTTSTSTYSVGLL